MRIEIHSLCSGLEQEGRAPDSRNVVTRTKRKLEREASASPRLRPLLAVLAAAALLAVLSIGAFAADKAIRAMRVKKAGDTVYRTPEGEAAHTDVEYALQFDVPQEGRMVAFRTGWMPRNVTEPYCVSLAQLLEEYEQRGERSPVTAMSPQTLEEGLVHLEWDYYEDAEPEADRPLHSLTIEIYSAGEIKNRDYLVQGSVRLIREDVLGGMEALYLESDLSGTVGRNLLLYDPDRGCVIVLGTDGSFETMEKVAGSLELIDTDLVSEDLNPEWSWSCIGLGGAKG